LYDCKSVMSLCKQMGLSFDEPGTQHYCRLIAPVKISTLAKQVSFNNRPNNDNLYIKSAWSRDITHRTKLTL